MSHHWKNAQRSNAHSQHAVQDKPLLIIIIMLCHIGGVGPSAAWGDGGCWLSNSWLRLICAYLLGQQGGWGLEEKVVMCSVEASQTDGQAAAAGGPRIWGGGAASPS